MKRCLGVFLFVAGVGCSSPPPATPDMGSNDVLLAPPAAGAGFQMAIPPFMVGPGQEIQNCYFFAVPGNAGEDVWFDHYTVAQTIGSHHMNVFRVNTIKNLGGKPGDMVSNGQCFISSNWSDWPLVMNSQDAGDQDWQLPSGVGAKFKAGELLMLQSHYVNATTQQTPGIAKVFVNFYSAKTTPQYELGTLFATNQNIRICPGETDKSFTKTCKFPSTGVNVIAANGHFHSRGTKFEMMPVDSQGNTGQDFYVSNVWNDPPMKRGFTLPLNAGSGVEWKCTYTVPSTSCGNPMDSCCFTFGGMVETQEHCNAFVYYYPKVQDVNCF